MVYLVIVGSLFSMKTERKTSHQDVYFAVVRQLPVQGCVSLLGHMFSPCLCAQINLFIFSIHTLSEQPADEEYSQPFVSFFHFKP